MTRFSVFATERGQRCPLAGAGGPQEQDDPSLGFVEGLIRSGPPRMMRRSLPTGRFFVAQRSLACPPPEKRARPLRPLRQPLRPNPSGFWKGLAPRGTKGVGLRAPPPSPSSPLSHGADVQPACNGFPSPFKKHLIANWDLSPSRNAELFLPSTSALKPFGRPRPRKYRKHEPRKLRRSTDPGASTRRLLLFARIPERITQWPACHGQYHRRFHQELSSRSVISRLPKMRERAANTKAPHAPARFPAALWPSIPRRARHAKQAVSNSFNASVFRIIFPGRPWRSCNGTTPCSTNAPGRALAYLALVGHRLRAACCSSADLRADVGAPDRRHRAPGRARARMPWPMRFGPVATRPTSGSSSIPELAPSLAAVDRHARAGGRARPRRARGSCVYRTRAAGERAPAGCRRRRSRAARNQQRLLGWNHQCSGRH